MKIHRFIGPFNVTEESLTITDKELVHQMHRVLRFEPGETIALCDGKGFEALYTVEKISKTEVILSQTEHKKECPKALVAVTLFAAILKKENFEYLAQKAAEIGVEKIVPVVTERTVKQGLNIERLEKIVREASELSGRGTIPEIAELTPFETALTMHSAFDEAWILHMIGEEKPATHPKNRAILVGPEGGFTEEELEKAHTAGWKTVSLSPLTFRGETGGIIGSYVASL